MIWRRALFLTVPPLVLGALLFGAWWLVNARHFQLAGELVSRVETERKWVALTFDDGPEPGFTEELLGILAHARVPATFFLVGEAVSRNPTQTRAIVEAGHELGNHSYSHRRMLFMSRKTVADELERTERLLREAGYRGPLHFRPPYGKKLWTLPRYLAERGILSITWDIEPDTGRNGQPTTECIVAEVVGKVRPGSIVLLHVMSPQRTASMRAVPRVIAALRERGYRFVRLSELLDAGEAEETAQRR